MEEKIRELIIRRTKVEKWYEQQGEEEYSNTIVWKDVNIVSITPIIWWGNPIHQSLCFIKHEKEIKNKRTRWERIKFWCSSIYEESGKDNNIDDEYLCIRPECNMFERIQQGNIDGKIIARLIYPKDIYKFFSRTFPTLKRLIRTSRRTNNTEKRAVFEWWVNILNKL